MKIFVIILLITCAVSLWAAPAKQPVYRFAYSVNSLDRSVTTFRIDESGRLRHYLHTPTRHTPSNFALHPSGRFLYTVSKTEDNVAVYRINEKNGTLKETRGSPYALSVGQPNDLMFLPNGQFLYIASLTGVVLTYSINEQSGALEPLKNGSISADRYTHTLVLHPSSRFLYAVNANADNISAYEISQKTGHLRPVAGSPFAVVDPKSATKGEDSADNGGATPYAASIDPSGRNMYVTNWAGSSISVFKISNKNGSLTTVRGSPFKTGLNPYAPSVHPSGNYLYVSSWITDAIFAYHIKPGSGALKPLENGEYSTQGYSPLKIVFNQSGNFAFVPNGESANIAQFEVDPKSGALNLIENIQTRPGPWGIEFLQAKEKIKLNSSIAFAVDSYSNKLASYLVNPETGNLGIAESNSTAANPRAVKVDWDNALVYVANGESNNLSVYWFDAQSGVTTEIPGSPFATGTQPVAIEIFGQYVYVVNKGSGSLSVFSYDAIARELKEFPSSPRAIGEQPNAIAIDATGRFAYITSEATNDITVLTYGSSQEPALLEKVNVDDTISSGKKPLDLVVDPSSRYLLVVSSGSDKIYSYVINYESGIPEPIKSSPFKAGDYPNGIVMHPNAKFVYVSNMRSKDIVQYEFNPLDGSLKEVKPRVAIGMKPSKMTMDATGHYLYIASEAIAEIKKFTIDQKNGKLSQPQKISTIGANAALTLSTQYE